LTKQGEPWTVVDVILPEVLASVGFNAIKAPLAGCVALLNEFTTILWCPCGLKLNKRLSIRITNHLVTISSSALAVSTFASCANCLILVIPVLVCLRNTIGARAGIAALRSWVSAHWCSIGTLLFARIAKEWLTVTVEITCFSSCSVTQTYTFPVDACHIVFTGACATHGKWCTCSRIWNWCTYGSWLGGVTPITNLAISCNVTGLSSAQVSCTFSIGAFHGARSGCWNETIGRSYTFFSIGCVGLWCTTYSSATTGAWTINGSASKKMIALLKDVLLWGGFIQPAFVVLELLGCSAFNGHTCGPEYCSEANSKC